jgi:HAD superfamily hydrolase (TIGR01484 family)
MKPLPAPTSPTAILSFDFDGTLHQAAENPPVPPEFFDLIKELRAEHRIVWGINTGRSMAQMVEGFIESRFPFLPDWVIAREHELFHPNPFGRWLPDSKWNKRCAKEIHKLFKHSHKLLVRLRKEIEQHTGAQWIELEGEPAGIISQTEEEMEWIVDHISPIVAAEPNFSWQRNSIYLRFGHREIQKGSSLAHVSESYGLPVERRFAIGDSHNDLEMLDPANASMTACPANSVADIKRKILATGGLLTRADHGYGAIEALRHYFPTIRENAAQLQ